MKDEADCRVELADPLRVGAVAPRCAGTGDPFLARWGGRLRPYQDLRAGFAPWRRVARVAWAERERARGLSGSIGAIH
jgi:hypothetical protein